MNTPLRILTIAAVLLTALFTTETHAQEENPVQILQESAAALKATPGFSAKVELSGDGSAMILNTLPSLNAQFTMGTHSELGKVLHLIGEFVQKEGAPPESFDIVYTPSKLIWTDHAKQTINIRPPSVSARQKPAPFKYLMFAELLKENPFESELAKADSVDLEPNQSIAGTDCRVVLITRPSSAGSKRSGVGAHNLERWYIGADDNLPRRVEHITDAGMIKATLIMELSNLTIKKPEDSELDVFRPDSYKVSDTTKARAQTPPKATAQAPNTTAPTNRSTETKQNTRPTTPSNPQAPNFSFTDTSSTTVTRASQAGRITVLYFYGSWSIPSKQTTPLFAELAREIQATDPTTPVDFYALAFRESDPQTLTDNHNNSSAAHALAINPSPTMAAQFKARVFPTIIVLDERSRIIASNSFSKDTTHQDLIDQTRAAINEAIN
ncbi:MAG: TlpA family protein disulfide reductase [Phycisphaerales bacterium]|nr:TlpA family protein disulfide reductase [Phycisphaerales bacterium]